MKNKNCSNCGSENLKKLKDHVYKCKDCKQWNRFCVHCGENVEYHRRCLHCEILLHEENEMYVCKCGCQHSKESYIDDRFCHECYKELK